MDTLPYGPATRAHLSFVLERSAFGRNRETAQPLNASGIFSSAPSTSTSSGEGTPSRCCRKRREGILCDPGLDSNVKKTCNVFLMILIFPSKVGKGKVGRVSTGEELENEAVAIKARVRL